MRFAHQAAIVLFAVLPAIPASAQVSIDEIERRFDEERGPLSQPGPLIPEFDPLSAPTEAAGITFELGGINLVGNSVLSDADLAPLYAGIVGSTISVAQLYEIANQITAFYGQNGFPLSRALVPAQEIDPSGEVTIRIVEGFVDRVVVESDAPPNPLIEAFSASLESERPISDATLERYLLLADDLPGVSARAVLRQSEDVEGGTTVVLEVTEEQPFSLSATVDNRGSEAVGPIQVDLVGEFYNIVHHNSETMLRFINADFSEELFYGSIEHMAVLNGEGTTLTFGFRHSTSEPGTSNLQAIDLETEATTGFIELRHPVIRSRNLNLEAFGQFELRNSETLAFGNRLSRDRLRSLRSGADFDNTDSFGGLNEVGLQFSFGLPIFASSSNDDPQNSREFGRVDYFTAVADVARTQQLGVLHPDLSAWSLRGSVMAQYAADALLSSEECGIGGSAYGRAFDSSTLSGDRCFAASVEARYTLPDAGLLDGLQLYGFYDYGWVGNLDPGADSNFLDSAGFGARFSLLDHVFGSAEVAQQIRNSGPGGRSDTEPRVFFSLTTRF